MTCLFFIRSECAHNLIMPNILEVVWLCVVLPLAPTTIYPFSDEYDDNNKEGFWHACFCIQSECADSLIMQNILKVFWLFVV